MKKVIFALGLSLLAGSQLFAQQNPAVANPVLGPSPLTNVGSQFDISFDIGNSGTLDIPGTSLGQKMTFTLSLGKCAPSVGNAVSTIGTNALSGTVLNYFDVIYDAPSKTFTGTQKSNVALGIIPTGMHTLTIHVQVTQLSSSISVNDIGANLNVQPNPAAAVGQGQPTSDDNASIFTHTVGGPLPVVLSAFDANAAGCSVALNWSTGKEENFDHFEVERSADSKSYSRIAAVKATGDNSTYNYSDNKPTAGLNTYRLKMVDVDGSSVYSPVTAAKTDCAVQPGIAVYPNPTRDAIHVSGINAGSTIRLMDMTGRMLKEKVNAQSLEILDLNGLPAALYTVQIVENGAVVTSVKVNKQ